MINENVTAILTVWKRNNLEEQLLTLSSQVETIIIYHCCDYIKLEIIHNIVEKFTQSNTNIIICHYDINLGYFGRFDLAKKLVNTPYVYIVDDDIIPSNNWINKIIIDIKDSEEPFIYSSAGRIINKSIFYPDRNDLLKYYIGDGWETLDYNYLNADTIVDFGCHSWLFPVEFLKIFDYYDPYTRDNGEDIHLSASCNISKGIRTKILAQPHYIPLKTENGNIKRKYNNDEYASWKKKGFKDIRQEIIKYWIDKKGWKPIEWQ